MGFLPSFKATIGKFLEDHVSVSQVHAWLSLINVDVLAQRLQSRAAPVLEHLEQYSAMQEKTSTQTTSKSTEACSISAATNMTSSFRDFIKLLVVSYHISRETISFDSIQLQALEDIFIVANSTDAKAPAPELILNISALFTASIDQSTPITSSAILCGMAALLAALDED